MSGLSNFLTKWKEHPLSPVDSGFVERGPWLSFRLHSLRSTRRFPQSVWGLPGLELGVQGGSITHVQGGIRSCRRTEGRGIFALSHSGGDGHLSRAKDRLALLNFSGGTRTRRVGPDRLLNYHNMMGIG